jgi:sec-independent protein translocase protein TatB
MGLLGASPGFSEILIVFIAVLVLFGPRQLPKLARRLGKLCEDLRSASQDFRDQIMDIDAESSSEAGRLSATVPSAEGADGKDSQPGGTREAEHDHEGEHTIEG